MEAPSRPTLFLVSKPQLDAAASPAAGTDNHGELMNQALTCAEFGQKLEAVRIYKKIVSENPRHFQAHYNVASLLMGMGEYEKARDHFLAASNVDPRNADACFWFARALEKCGEYPMAERQYRRAIALRPGHAETHYHLAMLLDFKMESYRPAVREYEIFRGLDRERDPQGAWGTARNRIQDILARDRLKIIARRPA
ncbi:MAG TPA: tetratricopeptide repeat protein [Candidatus Paceibacterota bacterium]|nr:tetratricopeptide repeat protein [Candidatus Paceibacterota bacterium]